jgi:hypothetical protein
MSVTAFVTRRLTQGSFIAGLHGDHAWKVTMVTAGELEASATALITPLPPEFRRQHIYEEHFQSKEMAHRLAKSEPGQREVVWRRLALGGPQVVRVISSFHCVTGVRNPTRAMTHATRQIDAPPVEGADLKPSRRIESEHEDIARKARELGSDRPAAGDQVRAFFEFVKDLATEPDWGPASALECLRQESGNSGSKSRLLIGLCRSRGIPARLVSGLILVGSLEQGAHFWAEAWVNGQWLPMCPTNDHYGIRSFPRNYLVLKIGDDDLVRGRIKSLQSSFIVQELIGNIDSIEEARLSTIQSFWRRISIYRLRPGEQHVVRFLMLLPLGALIVCLYRIVIGVLTYGTFAPALLGLAFLDLKSLPWGLTIFVLTVLVGWAIRHALDPYHLQMVARTAALLTLIVTFLIVMIMIGGHYELAGAQYVSLFPLVILTHLVERFWTIEAEDGPGASFKTLLGTLVVAVTVSVALSPDAVTNWLFRYPETTGLVLAAELLLGRYTGYRLSELYRFGDLIKEEKQSQVE